MYLDFYHFDRAPFQICNDPESLWEGWNYTCSRDIINYCLMNPGKTGLITGDTGTGKSFVIHALLKSLDQNILSAVISNTDFSIEDFYHQVAYAFQLPSQMANRHEIINFFHKRAADNSKTLLVLDEAQLLSRELTTEILQLAEMQDTYPFGLSICLVGQTGNSAIEGSAHTRYHFVPLSLDKTTQYLRHRLQVAGTTREIFTRDAISAIYRCSKGYPGMINALCDLALYLGCNEQKVIIDRAAIQQTIEKFHFTENQQNRVSQNKKNNTQSKRKTPLSRSISPADRPVWEGSMARSQQGNENPTEGKQSSPAKVSDKNQKTNHFFCKFCIVTLLLLLPAGGGYVYYKSNPGFANRPSTRLNTTLISANTIQSPSSPASAHQDSDFDAVGYVSDNHSQKTIVAGAATSTLPTDNTRENDRKKPVPNRINTVELDKKEGETDTVATNETPSIEVQATSTAPANPVNLKVSEPEITVKPEPVIISVSGSGTKLKIAPEHKANIEKKKIQIKKTFKTPHIPTPAPAAEKQSNHTKKTTSNTQPNPMDLIGWLLKKRTNNKTGRVLTPTFHG